MASYSLNGLGKKEIISDYLKSQKKEHLFKNGIPGDDWWYNFMKRHPEISIRKPQALQLCRAKASSPEIIDRSFFNILEPLLIKTGLKDCPSRIFNCLIPQTIFNDYTFDR